MAVDVSVIVPLYNEIGSIGELNTRITGVLEGGDRSFEIIYVDDGSTDGTFDLLEELSRGDPRIKAVDMKENSGQSAALGAGFKFASGRAAVTLDGDLQNPPEEVPKLLEALEKGGVDVVCGWRRYRKDPAGKRMPSMISNFLARRLTGVRVHDFGCTLRAYRGEVIKVMELRDGWHRYIPALAAWRGYRVGELEVDHHERRHGRTKYGPGRLVAGLLDLLNISYRMGRFPRPAWVFATTGVVLFSVGWFMTGGLGVAGGVSSIVAFALGIVGEQRMRAQGSVDGHSNQGHPKARETVDMAVERVEHEGELVAVIMRGREPVEGVRFITPPEFPLQLGIWSHGKGEVKKAHSHRDTIRTVKGTQEVIHVTEGVVAVDLYTTGGEKVGEHTLGAGDTILLVSGGHGFRVIKRARVVEVKQGPYSGVHEDKVFLE